jgi:hypothetical protein
MIYATLKMLHVPSIVVWIGGMVFAAALAVQDAHYPAVLDALVGR